MKDIYVTIYISKYYAKKLIKKDEYNHERLNYEVLGMKDYESPMVDIYDEEDYFVFTIYEDSVYFAGKATYLILKYTKGKAYCTSGYSENDVRYKYTYNPENNKVLVEGYNENSIEIKNNKLMKEFKELYDYLDRYAILSEDDSSWDKVESFFEKNNADISNANDIKEFANDKNIFILEWAFIEEYMKILRLAKNKFILEDKKLIFTHEYDAVKRKEKQSFWNILFGKNAKKEEKKLSWEEEEFERESKLFGLSKEDKRIAKQERMSPADFVEAEERDDDELVTDEWER